MKKCKVCGVYKTTDEYYRASRGQVLFPECKECSRRRAREWQRNRRAADPGYSNRMQLKLKYGLTVQDLGKILERQGGGCAICGNSDPGGKGRFHVDHDHGCCPGERSCGRCIRGLLCHGCNVGIGSLGESLDRLTSAVAYLLQRSNVLGEVANP